MRSAARTIDCSALHIESQGAVSESPLRAASNSATASVIGSSSADAIAVCVAVKKNAPTTSHVRSDTAAGYADATRERGMDL